MANDTHPNLTAVHDPRAHVYPNHPHMDVDADNGVSAFARELEVDLDEGLAFVATASNDWDRHRALIDSAVRLRTRCACPTAVDRSSVSSSSRIVYAGIAGMFLSTNNLNPVSSAAEGDETISSTQYAFVEVKTQANTSATVYDLYATIPNSFSGWDTNGIRLLSRVSSYGGSGTFTVQIEAMDPATGASFGTPKTASRGVTSSEGTYSYLTINSTTLSTDFSALDLLKLRITLQSSTATAHTIRFSDLELLWN